jgi:hypothetical protein
MAHRAAGRERETDCPLIGKAIGERNQATSPPSPPMAGTCDCSRRGSPAEKVNGAMLPMNATAPSSRMSRRTAAACLPGSAASSTWMTFTGRPWTPPLALTHFSHTVRPRNPLANAEPTRPDLVPTAPSTIGSPDAGRRAPPPVVPPAVPSDVPPAVAVAPPLVPPVVPPSVGEPASSTTAGSSALASAPSTVRSMIDVAVGRASSVTRVPQAATIRQRASTSGNLASARRCIRLSPWPPGARLQWAEHVNSG